MLPKRKLMIPGPAEVEDHVLAAMGEQVAAHYGPEWAELYGATVAGLKGIFGTEGDVFLLAGPGNAGVEAVVATLFAPGERVLIGNNGFFGDRMKEIARSRGVDVVEVTAVWSNPLDPAAIDAALSQDPSIVGLIAVHHETSTGVLNPIQQLGAVARKHDVLFAVDTIASLGAEIVKMDAWGIDAAVASSNKGLGSFPGLAPVAVGSQVWERIAHKTHKAGWYLDLRTWQKYGQDAWHPSPVTVSSNAVAALHAGVQAIVAEGLENRVAEFRRIAELFRGEIGKRGFGLLAEGACASSVLTAVIPPPHINITHLLNTLREEKGIHVGNGLGKLNGHMARVGHLGLARSEAYVAALLEAIDDYMS
ncbi:MAG: alanine--glyoxylate aminotransferase family protein [Chloroflexota bacterium]